MPPGDPRPAAYDQVELLTKKFKSLSTRRLHSYNEADTRKDFILPLFHALQWDTANSAEVAAEEKMSRGFVDFSFRINSIRRFVLETKRIGSHLDNRQWAQQAIDYAYYKGLTWAVLSDFEILKVFNAEIREADPFQAVFKVFRLDEYLTRFEELWWLSKPGMIASTLDREAEKVFKKVPRLPVSQSLFNNLTKWRQDLYKNLRGYNDRKLYPDQMIDDAVQRVLDRLIFVRTAEDRQVESESLISLVRELRQSRRINDLISRLNQRFRELDKSYNSQLFAPHYLEDLECEPSTLVEIIEGLYSSSSGLVKYNFDMIDSDVLGKVYEQYLSYVLHGQEEFREKRVKRKSQGIYYTPTFVVRYIVQQTLGRHLKDNGYNPAHPVRVLDPACGSGSFLIEAFDVLDQYLARQQNQSQGTYTIVDHARQMQILMQDIYGVDKDEQAVEIARLNLMLKALHLRDKLPVLENIRQGNSLITGTDAQLQGNFGAQWKEQHPFDWQKEFSDVMVNGGFDVIIGNPPYFNIETLGKHSPEAEWVKSSFPEVWMDKSDILFYFIARAIQLLHGRLAFIVSRAFLEADKAQKLRQFILERCAIETVIDFQNFLIFEDASIPTAIIVLRREASGEARRAAVIQVAKVHIWEGRGEELMAEIESKLADGREHEDEALSTFTFPQASLAASPWTFASNRRLSLYSKADDGHAKLGDICFVGEGMQTGANDVFEVQVPTINIDQLEKEFLKKRASNSDIHRYHIQHSGSWLIWVEDCQEVADCPKHVASYLRRRSKRLKERAAYLRGNCEWYKYTWPLHKEWHSTPKIIVPYRAAGSRFALDASAEYIGLTDTTCIFKRASDQHDLRYYLALLNSKLLQFRLRGFAKMTGSGLYEYFENSVSKLPIRQIDFNDAAEKAEHAAIVALVNEMLQLQGDYAQALRQKLPARDSLKRRIDQVDAEIEAKVNVLYELTSKEVAMIQDDD